MTAAPADLVTAMEGVDFAAIRAHRTARVRQVMDEFDLDAIAAFEYANGRLLADLRPLWAPNFVLRQAVLVSRTASDPIVLVHQDDAPHRRQLMDWVPPDRIREFPTAAFIESATPAAVEPVRTALEELGFTGGRIGVDITTVTALDNLTAAVPEATWVDVTRAMNVARVVKSPEEIELMGLASQVVDLALEAAIGAIRPGVRECEILAEAMAVFYRHGAEVPQCNLIVCSGPNTSPMQRYAGTRRVEPGDLVFMDIGACFGGIFSEATRTVVLGEPHPDQTAIHTTVLDIHRRTIDAMVPGATGEDLQAAGAQGLEGSPYAGHMLKLVLIHGIGVGYAESPFVRPPGTPTAPLTLEPGMTLAVVPTILVPGVPGGGGVRLEDVVAVTDDGPDVLTRYPFDFAVPG
jgi:Xaa-Pro aminopeptidase